MSPPLVIPYSHLGLVWFLIGLLLHGRAETRKLWLLFKLELLNMAEIEEVLDSPACKFLFVTTPILLAIWPVDCWFWFCSFVFLLVTLRYAVPDAWRLWAGTRLAY